jgi:hypothetical protein
MSLEDLKKVMYKRKYSRLTSVIKSLLNALTLP